MRRWLPFPLPWVLLLALWLLLNQTLAPGQVILGALVALVATHGLKLLDPPPTRLRRMATLLELVGPTSFADVARSNMAVARIILVRGAASASLRLRIACSLVAAPGRAGGAGDDRRGHAGDCMGGYGDSRSRDLSTLLILELIGRRNVWSATIKRRYERHLLEIFE